MHVHATLEQLLLSCCIQGPLRRAPRSRSTLELEESIPAVAGPGEMHCGRPDRPKATPRRGFGRRGSRTGPRAGTDDAERRVRRTSINSNWRRFRVFPRNSDRSSYSRHPGDVTRPGSEPGLSKQRNWPAVSRGQVHHHRLFSTRLLITWRKRRKSPGRLRRGRFGNYGMDGSVLPFNGSRSYTFRRLL